MTAARPPAAVLFGGLSVLNRHARLITAARERGLSVLVATGGGVEAEQRLAAWRARPDHPFAGIAGHVLLPGPRVDGVVAAVRERFARYDIRAVLSCGEVFVEPCGLLADLLGLPGPGLRASRVCRDKQLQRSYLAELSPRSAYLPADERDRAAQRVPGYPAVVKPTGRMSSSGVRRVDRPDELAEAVAAARPAEALLLEELVHGPEFSVEALVRDGEVIWENVTGKLTNEAGGRFFTEMRHVVPAAGLSGPDRRALLETNRQALALLDFRTGISHAEFRLAPGRGPVLMEIAARVPGDGITLLFALATGAPVEPVLLDLALGEPTAYPPPRRRAVHQYLDTGQGALMDVHTVDGPATSWVADGDPWPDPAPAAATADARAAAVFAWRQRGAPLGPLRDSDDRAASVMIDLPLEEPVEPAVTRLAARTTVTVADQASAVRG